MDGRMARPATGKSDEERHTMTTSFSAASLSDRHLIAKFMRGRKGKTALERAHDVFEQCGSYQLLMSHRQARTELLSETEYEQLQAALELARRYIYESVNLGNALSSPDQVRDYIRLRLHGLEHEVFSALFLDNRHRVFEYRELFQGTIDSAAVYPREVVKHCLSCNAAAVIFSHNHPSGVAEPSDSDIRLTRKLTDALGLIDVRVLDHLIVGTGVITSLAERGLM